MEVIIGQVQTIEFGGMFADHQNEVSESSINTVAYMACTIMIYAGKRSPEGFSTIDIWPMDMDYACWVHNRTHKESTGLSPYEVWTGSTYTTNKDFFRDCHIFGAPTCVLETRLQKADVKIPKCQPRIRRAKFM